MHECCSKKVRAQWRWLDVHSNKWLYIFYLFRFNGSSVFWNARRKCWFVFCSVPGVKSNPKHLHFTALYCTYVMFLTTNLLPCLLRYREQIQGVVYLKMPKTQSCLFKSRLKIIPKQTSIDEIEKQLIYGALRSAGLRNLYFQRPTADLPLLSRYSFVGMLCCVSWISIFACINNNKCLTNTHAL